jgi:hypothetical protein
MTADLNALKWKHWGLVVQTGSPDFQKLIATTKLDLSSPDNECVFFYALVPAVGADMFEYGECRGKAKDMIGLIQESMARWLQSTYQQTVSLPVTGNYDCDTAKLMRWVAQAARQTGAGDIDAWQMGKLDFAFLYNASAHAQLAMTGAAAAAGRQYTAGFAVLPPKQVVDYLFVPPGIPAGCSAQPGTGVADELPPGETPPGMIVPVGASDAKKSSTWKWVVGLAVAAGALGYAASRTK